MSDTNPQSLLERWEEQTSLTKLGVYVIAYSLVYAFFGLMGWSG